MSIRDFKARTWHAADSAQFSAGIEGVFQYSVGDFLDRAITAQLGADIAEATSIANRAIFTDEFARIIAERHAAALEGALKGLRKRRLMDEGRKP